MRAAVSAAAILGMVLLALPAAGQTPAPRDEFVAALGRFSVALEGNLGDEGPAIHASLDAMDRALRAWDALIRSYESAMAAEIGSADPALAARMHVALGGFYLDRARVTDALREFGAAQALDPNRADVHALLGAVHSQVTGNVAAAANALRQAATLDPANPIRAYVLARHLAATGKDADNTAVFRVFLQSPALGQALESRTAIRAPFIRPRLVEERANVEPFFPPVRYAAGYARLASGDYGGAIASFRDAFGEDPLIADAGPHRDAIQRAAESIRAGLVSQAIEHLNEAASRAPDRAEPLRVLGRAYALDGEYDHALTALQRAVALDSQDERARVALASTFVEAGRFEDAHEALNATLSALPASGRSRYAAARLYQREGRLTEALAEFDRAAALEPLLGLNGLYETIGELHARQQHLDRAREAHGRRVDLHPNDPEAHHDLADISLRLGRHDEAVAELSVVLLLDPASAKAATMKAQAHLKNGDYDAAAAAARRAIEIDATLTEAHYVLGTVLLRLKRVDEGNRELEIYRRLENEAAVARARLLEIEGLRREASVSAAAGDHSRAVASLRKVLELEVSYTSRLQLGLALLDADRAAEALEHLTAAATHGDARYEIHRYLAAAYATLGRPADSQREQAAYERIRREDIKRRASR